MGTGQKLSTFMRFARALRAVGVGTFDPVLFPTLQAAYNAPERYYHTLAHIGFCLQALDGVWDECEHPEEIEVALWFHDAVYDPQAQDNEARSAAWAGDVLRESEINPDAIARVENLILATAHKDPPTSPDQAWIIDIDLAILGQPETLFAEYDAAIRREYAWVGDEAYRVGRTAVLDRFLARPTIYRTSIFQQQYEAQARKNLTAARNALRQ